MTIRLATAALIALGVVACGSDDTRSAPAAGGSGGGAGVTDGGGGAPNDSGTGGVGGKPEAGAPKVLLPRRGIDAAELGVLVNKSDPQSVEVAAHYQQARGIPAQNVVELSFPKAEKLSASEFAALKTEVDAKLPGSVQALAITWTHPYRVDCMSVTSAFALGFDKKYCNTTGSGCGATASIDYFDSQSVYPLSDHALRPTMMIAGAAADAAKAVIDRGVQADDTYPAGKGYLVRTTDTARSVRWPRFKATVEAWTHPDGLALEYVDDSSGSGKSPIQDQQGLLFYFTGLANVPAIETNQYRPGAIADHLTSFGGQVLVSSQMGVEKWLEAGATASFGTVVEPCNYTAKFPDPYVLVPHYFRGNTLIEAYWKSVLAPGEGLFVGEPLARPWGSAQVSFEGGTLTIVTTHLQPGKLYVLEEADAEAGPFKLVSTGIQISEHQRFTMTLPNATAAVYRLVEQN